MNAKPIEKHRVASAFVKLLTELTDQLQEARNDRIVKRNFGLYGEGAFAALLHIREGLRGLVKWGGSREFTFKADEDGRVDVEEVYSAVYDAINEHCPNMEEVWG